MSLLLTATGPNSTQEALTLLALVALVYVHV